MEQVAAPAAAVDSCRKARSASMQKGTVKTGPRQSSAGVRSHVWPSCGRADPRGSQRVNHWAGRLFPVPPSDHALPMTKRRGCRPWQISRRLPRTPWSTRPRQGPANFRLRLCPEIEPHRAQATEPPTAMQGWAGPMPLGTAPSGPHPPSVANNKPRPPLDKNNSGGRGGQTLTVSHSENTFQNSSNPNLKFKAVWGKGGIHGEVVLRKPNAEAVFSRNAVARAHARPLQESQLPGDCRRSAKRSCSSAGGVPLRQT